MSHRNKISQTFPHILLISASDDIAPQLRAVLPLSLQTRGHSADIMDDDDVKLSALWPGDGQSRIAAGVIVAKAEVEDEIEAETIVALPGIVNQ